MTGTQRTRSMVGYLSATLCAVQRVRGRSRVKAEVFCGAACAQGVHRLVLQQQHCIWQGRSGSESLFQQLFLPTPCLQL